MRTMGSVSETKGSCVCVCDLVYSYASEPVSATNKERRAEKLEKVLRGVNKRCKQGIVDVACIRSEHVCITPCPVNVRSPSVISQEAL